MSKLIITNDKQDTTNILIELEDGSQIEVNVNYDDIVLALLSHEQSILEANQIQPIKIGEYQKALLNKDEKFRYQLLSRMKMDCDYYLGNGGKNKKHLWADDEQEQIETMKLLWNSFDDDKKPEWLTWDELLEYEKKLTSPSE